MNAALSGYASRRIVPIVEEIARHEPDIVLVYMGHNEWAERRYYQHLIDMDPRVFRLWQRVFSLRLYRLIAGLLLEDPADVLPRARPVDIDAATNANQMFGVLRARAEGSQYATKRDLAYRDELYEFNLRAIADRVAEAGGTTVFLTLSQNFADWPPGASRHRDDLRDDEREEWQQLLERALALGADGLCRDALALFDEALAIDDGHAGLHFERARCERSLGEMAAARASYRRASDLDAVPQGAPLHFNAILRDVAGDTGSVLIDVEGALAAESEHALVGDDLFVDQMHPNLRAHQRIAATVASELREAGLIAPTEEWRTGGATLPEPRAVRAANPGFEVREIELRMLACSVAARDDCAAEHARRLLAREPGHSFATFVLEQPRR